MVNNILNLIWPRRGYPKLKYHCPECNSELEPREGMVRDPITLNYRFEKCLVCPKHNWGWEIPSSEIVDNLKSF